VTIVDYGMGNLLSVARALEHCGAEVELASEPGRVAEAERLVLPGVGAFPDGMRELRRRSLVEALLTYAASRRPLLGICLGMHLLMESSEEHGVHEGLGLVEGGVAAVPRVDAGGNPQKVPIVGWRPLVASNGHGWSDAVLRGIDEGESFYFVHSYTASPSVPGQRVADIRYGERRVAAVLRAGAIVGTQFHPEKSGPAGLRLLANFIEGGAASNV
jgi:glutamine amidotransferase